MTLRELIEKAAKDIRVYREPDIAEAEERIDEILGATDHPLIKYEHVVSLEFSGGMLLVGTEYGGGMTDNYTIPEHVIDADDPVTEMKKWGRHRRIQTLEDLIPKMETEIGRRRRELEELKCLNQPS